MEKIVIRPQSKDILINNDANQELSEVFSYDYTSVNGATLTSKSLEEVNRKLGSLFIVGHVQPKTEETSYILSLIASLAKREYYADTELEPKTAFSNTLKKINEALQDFFSKKDSDADIGVFAVSNENLLISKLGRFKIFLARDKQTIDILNNINLFEKDRDKVKETEFSNVVSGKILADDKILAYYPNKSTSSRERFLKIDLLQQNEDDLIGKLASTGKSKPNFTFAGIYLTIKKFKETAVTPRPIPTELKNSENPINEPDIQGKVVLTGSKLAKKIAQKQSMLAKIKPTGEETPESTVPVHNMTRPQQIHPPNINEAPILIPGEFSQAKKSNILEIVYKNSLNLVLGILNPRIRNIRVRLATFTAIAVILVTGGFLTKKFLFENNENKQTNVAITEAENGLKLAQSKMTQNEISSARQILSASLINILSVRNEDNSEETEAVTREIISFMDQIDNAKDASVTNVESLPESVAKAKTIKEDTLNRLNNGDYEGISVFADGEYYEGNFYVLTAGQIFKIASVETNKDKATKWLEDSEVLPPEGVFIAIDGDIYVLGKNGNIRTYFKGKQGSEGDLNIVINENFEFLAHNDVKDNLYLLNKTLGRIYVINKESKSITNTLKINNDSAIKESYLAEDSSIYLVMEDGKILKVN